MRAAFFAVILPVAPLRGAIADVDWRGHAIASSGDTRMLHGRASFYGNRFIGRETASGERYDADAMTAAHKTLPIGTKVRVTVPQSSCGSTIADRTFAAGRSTFNEARRERSAL